MTLKLVNQVFFLLELPHKQVALLGWRYKVFEFHVEKDICDVVFILCECFVLEDEFSIHIMEGRFELWPRKNAIIGCQNS